jgi:hypothetical protein
MPSKATIRRTTEPPTRTKPAPGTQPDAPTAGAERSAPTNAYTGICPGCGHYVAGASHSHPRPAEPIATASTPAPTPWQLTGICPGCGRLTTAAHACV